MHSLQLHTTPWTDPPNALLSKGSHIKEYVWYDSIHRKPGEAETTCVVEARMRVILVGFGGGDETGRSRVGGFWGLVSTCVLFVRCTELYTYFMCTFLCANYSLLRS